MRASPLLSLGLLCCASVAHAEPAAPSDRAGAEALFDEGRALLRDNRLVEACAKLEESQRLDPGIGTLLYLGDCYQRSGRVVSAWVTFRDAHAAATAAGQTVRAELAKRHADALAPELPSIVVNVRAVPGIKVERGGVDVGPASWGVPLPVDPGEVVVVATADGYEPFRKVVSIARAERVAVDIPELAKRESADARGPVGPLRAPPPAASAQERGPSWQRPVGLGVGGVGLAGLAFASVFGALTFTTWSAAQDECPRGRCTAKARDTADSARTYGNVSTAAFVAGGVLAAAGAFLFFTAPSSRGDR